MIENRKMLIYGYGNPGRQDDGLGPALVSKLDLWLKENNYNNVITDSNYQLNIEDAAVIFDRDPVIFVDATQNNIPSYQFDPLEPSPKKEFTMHAVSPAFVLSLCESIYSRKPETYLLQIKGYEWKFLEEITEQAANNLEQAFEFIKEFIIRHFQNNCET